MKLLAAAFGCCLFWSMTAPLAGAEPTNRAEFRVVGYLPDYRWAEFNPAAASRLTDLILFSAEPRLDGGLDLSRFQNCPWAKLRAFKTRQRVRLLLAVGGWDRSTHFAAVAGSREKRSRFAEQCVRLCLDQRLDGIDLDWEHPQNDAEAAAYGDLLTGLRAAFDPHGLILTVTIAGWQKLPPSAIPAVDGVQVMAYDQDGQHSTFEGARRDVQTLLDARIPAAKLILGLPLYGRDTETREAQTYAQIIANHNPRPGTDQVGRLYFNGPDTIRRKTRFALESRLGGVMVWELGQDAPGDRSLLKTIRDTLTETK